jgi:thiol-disulfide isomerase/thioredoxin
MTYFCETRDEENATKRNPDEERKHMSPRSENTSHHQTARTLQRGRLSATLISAVIGVIAVALIITYAVLRANHAVPGAAVATSAPSLPPPAAVGSQAPHFEVRGRIGKFSSADLAGEPYLLEIFATWCPHCQRMTKVLRAIRASVPLSRLVMISVTGSPYAANATPDQPVPENQQDVDAFDAAYSVTWLTLFDPDLTVVRSFGLDGFPTIFVVNGKGKIVYSGSGEISQADLMKAIHAAGA